MTTHAEGAVRARLEKLGLAANVQDDLVALAGELATVTGKPINSTLDTIEQEVRATMEHRILRRVQDTLTYNGDLERKPL